MLQVLFE